jgi:hypothetical protein
VSAIIRINIENGAVFGLIFWIGRDTEEYAINFGRLLERELQPSSNPPAMSPLSVPNLVLASFGDAAESIRYILTKEVWRIETATGMTSLVISTRKGISNENGDVQYAELVRDVHGCNTDLTLMVQLLDFEAEFGEFCASLPRRFEALRKRAGLRRFHTLRNRETLDQQLEFFRGSSRGRHRQVPSLRARVQGQMEVVSFFIFFYLLPRLFIRLLFFL